MEIPYTFNIPTALVGDKVTVAGIVVGPDPPKARLDLWQRVWDQGHRENCHIHIVLCCPKRRSAMSARTTTEK